MCVDLIKMWRNLGHYGDYTLGMMTTRNGLHGCLPRDTTVLYAWYDDDLGQGMVTSTYHDNNYAHVRARVPTQLSLK